MNAEPKSDAVTVAFCSMLLAYAAGSVSIEIVKTAVAPAAKVLALHCITVAGGLIAEQVNPVPEVCLAGTMK